MGGDRGAWLRPILTPGRYAAVWWVVVAAAVATVVVLAPPLPAGDLLPAGPGFWLFAVLVVFWDVRPIIMSGGYDPQGVNLSLAFVFAAMLRWGLSPALVLLAVGTLAGEFAVRKSPVVAVFNVAQYTLSFVAAWQILRLGGMAPSLAEPGLVAAADLPTIIAAFAAYHVANLWLVGLLLAARSGRTLRAEFFDDFLYYTVSTAVVLAVSPLLVVLVDVEWLFVLLLVPPLLAVHRTAEMSLAQEHLSLHDGLTGLANRKRLEQAVEEGLGTRQAVVPAALLLLDLDRFKQVNDTLGHPVGDELLVQVGTRLREDMRDGDVVARLGGDEFAVWLASAEQDQAVEVAERLRSRLRAPFELSSMDVEVDASVGIAMRPEHGATLGDLLRCADVAMYAAKEVGGGIQVYASHRDHNTVSRFGMIAELRRGLVNGELLLHYQPKVRLLDGVVVGVEALVRWQHPRLGLIQPRDFLDVADQSGLMRAVTDEVVTMALTQTGRWVAEGLDLVMAVNIAPRDLADPRFLEVISRVLEQHGLSPRHLQLEVTEHTLLDTLGVDSRVAQLANLGLGISIDDFGTGYSSLTHLRRLPVTEVKIDETFVNEMHDNEDIVRSIVQLAHTLGLVTVAEGVETLATWDALLAAGCDMAQGHVVSRPLTADEATDLLRHGRVELRPTAAGTPGR